MIATVSHRVRHMIDRHLRGRVATCQVRGHTIVLETQTDMERFRARTYATKEPETLDWIEQYLRPDDVLYDIGANIGLYALYAAKVLGGRCSIYAFEPEALNHAKLSVNIYRNRLSGVVLPCCVALTDTLGFGTFYLHPCPDGVGGRDAGLVAGSSLHSFGVAEDFRGLLFEPNHQQGTIGVQLDTVWREWGLPFPNHVKIDVDGLEAKVIAGATQTLADPRLRSVLVEIQEDRQGADALIRTIEVAGLHQVTEFSARSRRALVGSPYAGSVNYVFAREAEAVAGRMREVR